MLISKRLPGLLIGSRGSAHSITPSNRSIPPLYKPFLKIKANVMLKSGTVLCGEGFNYKRQKDNTLKFLEHPYGVTIERNCTIGANCAIDRGRHRNTVIGKGTKLDNQVYVAHNVLIGENCIIGAHSSILGSVEIGNNCEIWTGAIIHQGVKIGDNSIIGANAYIRHNVPANTVTYCNWKQVTIKPKKESKKYAAKI